MITFKHCKGESRELPTRESRGPLLLLNGTTLQNEMPPLQKPVANNWKTLTRSSKSLLLPLSLSNHFRKKINKVFSNLVLASSRKMVLTPYCDMPSLLTRWIQVDLLDKYSWLVQKTAADHTCWSMYRTCIRISFLQRMERKSDTLLK